MRIQKVYTRGGDEGETSLVGGARTSKASLRVSAYGDVDELNSALGLVRAHFIGTKLTELDGLLADIQRRLFILGADLAAPMDVETTRMHAGDTSGLEPVIDRLNEEVGDLKEFILPGGGIAGAHFHMARTICRRAERLVVALHDSSDAINPHALTYLNRLSDLLFVMARVANHRENSPEEQIDFAALAKRSDKPDLS